MVDKRVLLFETRIVVIPGVPCTLLTQSTHKIIPIIHINGKYGELATTISNRSLPRAEAYAS